MGYYKEKGNYFESELAEPKGIKQRLVFWLLSKVTNNYRVVNIGTSLDFASKEEVGQELGELQKEWTSPEANVAKLELSMSYCEED